MGKPKARGSQEWIRSADDTSIRDWLQSALVGRSLDGVRGSDRSEPYHLIVEAVSRMASDVQWRIVRIVRDMIVSFAPTETSADLFFALLHIAAVVRPPGLYQILVNRLLSDSIPHVLVRGMDLRDMCLVVASKYEVDSSLAAYLKKRVEQSSSVSQAVLLLRVFQLHSDIEALAMLPTVVGMVHTRSERGLIARLIEVQLRRCGPAFVCTWFVQRVLEHGSGDDTVSTVGRALREFVVPWAESCSRGGEQLLLSAAAHYRNHDFACNELIAIASNASEPLEQLAEGILTLISMHGMRSKVIRRAGTSLRCDYPKYGIVASAEGPRFLLTDDSLGVVFAPDGQRTIRRNEARIAMLLDRGLHANVQPCALVMANK